MKPGEAARPDFRCKFAVICLFSANQEIAMLQIQDQARASAQKFEPAAALRGFFAIAQAWGLNTEDARA
ncbi:MAG: hypothetical protein B7Z81_01455, partial [Acidocella sp. 20-61-6]